MAIHSLHVTPAIDIRHSGDATTFRAFYDIAKPVLIEPFFYQAKLLVKAPIAPFADRTLRLYCIVHLPA